MHIKRMISMTSMSPDSCIFLYTEKCYIYFILFFIFLLSLKMKRTEICMCFEHIVDSRNLWLGFSYLSFMSIILYVQLFFFTFRFYHKFFLLIFHTDVLNMWSWSVLKRRKHRKVMGFCGEGEGDYLSPWCSYSGECPFHSSDRCLAEVLYL